MPIKHTPEFRRFINRIALLSAVIGFISLTVIFYQIWQQRQAAPFVCETWLESSIRPLAIATTVVQVEQAKWIYLADESLRRIRLCECAPSPCPLQYVEEGDSLFKVEGSLVLYLKTESGRRDSLDFPCCE